MLDAYVFSFNRGEFLENCIKSIQTCAPGTRVTILDDNSTDSYTLAVLSALQNGVRIILPQNDQTETKTGGLYGNMNVALEIAEESKCEYALFIQDDMQLVRPLQPVDLEMIQSFFELNTKAIQYQTCFRRRDTCDRLKQIAFLDASKTAFLLPDYAEEGKDNFSATGVFHIRRVKECLGSFAVGEGANSKLCREIGIKKGLASYPFMNWLPYPSSFRGKKRSFSHSVIERLGGAGFHPIEIMSNEEADILLGKDPNLIPVAEDWLSAPTAPRQYSWSTGGGEYNLVARGGIPAFAFKKFKNFSRLMSRLKR